MRLASRPRFIVKDVSTGCTPLQRGVAVLQQNPFQVLEALSIIYESRVEICLPPRWGLNG
jgi:hypothetical protein